MGALGLNDIGDMFENYYFEESEQRNIVKHFDIFPIDCFLFQHSLNKF
jgi:hypothetical protein